MTNNGERPPSGGVGRRLFLASASAVTSAVLLPGAVAQAKTRGTAPRTLRFSDHEPLGGMRTRFLNDVVFPAIEKESKGRLKIEAHWSSELAISYDALRAVGDGVVTDLATVVPEYAPEQLPLQQIFKGFPVGPAGSRQVDFFRRAYADVPALTSELETSNTVPLFFGTGYPLAFYGTAPLPDVDAVRGGRWRTASFWHQDFLANAGATPVTLPWGPGIFDALESGELDGLVVNVDSGYMLNAHEAAPHVLVSKDLWLGHVYVLAMNKGAWDELLPSDRLAIQRGTARAYRTLGPVMDRSFDTQLDHLRQAGANVRRLTAGEVKRWQTATQYREVQESWVDEQRAKGIAEVDAVHRGITRIMNRTLP
ncbi:MULTISPECIES: hypothetical protein [unclassified Streptomyces]|uniref:hypothetical protein n=1 Tax=unclassified Streptomyces TaxID=2593676 RepID=UPI0035DC48E4